MVSSGGGEGSSASGSIMEALLTMLLSDRYSSVTGDTDKVDRSPEAEALRQQIYLSMKNKSTDGEDNKLNK